MSVEVVTVRVPEVLIAGIYERPAFWNAAEPRGRLSYKMSDKDDWRHAEADAWRWSFPEVSEELSKFA